MPPDQPQGTPSQTEQGKSDDAPKYVTEEQLNRAITSRFGDLQKKLDKQFEGISSSIVGKLEEIVTGKLDGLKPQGGAGGEPKDAKSVDIENHPLVKGLQRQIADGKAATDQLKQERDAEKARARTQNLRSTLAESLTKGGVDPAHVSKAVGILVDVEKRVRFVDDESDELVFKDSTGDVDLGSGLKGWLKSDDAKIFLPPRGTQGAGDRSQGKPPTNGAPVASVGSALLGMARSVMGENPNG